MPLDLGKFQLTVHAGLVIRDEEIEAFMTTLGPGRPTTGDPFNDLDAWLVQEDLIWRFGMFPSRVKMPGQSDNPVITVIEFGKKRLRFEDVHFTDAGVVPNTLPPASDEVKRRARGWLDLDPSDDDYDVSALADRFAFVESNTDDDSIRCAFAAMAKVTGKAPKDLQFALVYRLEGMLVYQWHSKHSAQKNEGREEELKEAQSYDCN